MTNPFSMPPVGFGPGSQAGGDGDDALDYMSLPQDMRTYSQHLPDIDGSADDLKPAFELLEAIAVACARAADTGEGRQFDLRGLDEKHHKVICETLGEGEVAAKVHEVPAIAVQESVFAGVWRLKGANIDCVEVGSIPECVTRAPFKPRREGMLGRTALIRGVVNAPPLLSELRDKSAKFTERAELHVVNLSLLPHTEEDLVWLDQAMGEGTVTLLSRGYGNCRITATVMPYVWRVQFFNSMDTLILDTFEVTRVPEVALAAPEDLADSGARILQVIEAMA